MKAAGTNTLAILSSGLIVKAELYTISLVGGATLLFTDYDLPLTVGANTFLSNMVVVRGSVKQQTGTDVTSLDLELSPQRDAISQPLVGGVSFLQACRLGYLDGARVTMAKCFMVDLDNVVTTQTNNESVNWFTGVVASAVAGRQKATIAVESDLSMLSVQMPRNVLQTGCNHTFCDSGCTLVKATYTTSSSVTATGPNTTSSFTTGLAKADGYFALGYITFTSGANNGASVNVKASALTNGVVTLVDQLPVAPATGDTFTIVAGCDKLLATCKTKWAADNSSHFRGFPFIPVPETLYGGGSISAPVPTIARQGQPGTGSPWGGRVGGRFKA